jgi:hypothetical protein
MSRAPLGCHIVATYVDPFAMAARLLWGLAISQTLPRPDPMGVTNTSLYD